MHHILGGDSPCVKDPSRSHLRSDRDDMPDGQRVRRERGHHVRAAMIESLGPVEVGDGVLHAQHDGAAERSNIDQVVSNFWKSLERIFAAHSHGLEELSQQIKIPMSESLPNIQV